MCMNTTFDFQTEFAKNTPGQGPEGPGQGPGPRPQWGMLFKLSLKRESFVQYNQINKNTIQQQTHLQLFNDNVPFRVQNQCF